MQVYSARYYLSHLLSISWKSPSYCGQHAGVALRRSVSGQSCSGWRTLHSIECLIGCRKELFDGLSVVRENGTANGRRDRRTFSVRGDEFADSCSNLPSLRRSCFGKHHSKLVAPESGRRVNLPAMSPKDIG